MSMNDEVISWAGHKEDQNRTASRQDTLASISCLKAIIQDHSSWLATDRLEESIPGKFEFKVAD